MSFTQEEIAAFAYDHYRLEGELTKLSGYDELNYLIETRGEKFVLKLADRSHSQSLLEAQIAMTNFLSEKGMEGFIPEYLSNEENSYITQVHSSGGEEYRLRSLTYIEGNSFAEASDHPGSLLENIGQFLGRMDKAMTDFDHPGAHREFEWDIAHALDWRKDVNKIPSPENRRLVEYFLLQFEMEVQPYFSELRKSVIHNDANDWNVLTENDQVCGLIDFGDIVYTPVINNLAVSLAYIMLEKKDPIETAASVIRGYHQHFELTEKEVELLYNLIAVRLCVSLTSSAKRRFQGSTNPHHFLSEKPAWKLMHQLIRINPIKAHQAFRSACDMDPLYQENEDYSALLKERKEFIGRNLSISYRNPLKIIRGALQYLYDDRGNTYLDCVNNVSHVGHCHPRVVRAMQEQIATLNTNTRYLHDRIESYAERLCDTLPASLSVCYFTNSGSEANDLAVRMARQYTDQEDVIVLDHAYHGTSTLAIEMSPYKFDGPGGFSKPDYIHKAQSPDLYRGEFRYDDPSAGKKYALSVKEAVNNISEANKKPAAFICETLLGVGGQLPLPEGYLAEAYKYVREAGGVCIADEVQVGFGRVGSEFWGFELQEVVPDIVVMGKPMGNGHPLSAVVTTGEIADSFDNGMEYFNTFGGNPVSMTTGEAVLNVIFEEELQKNALEVGNYLLDKLKKIKEKYPVIGDVRGRGLFMGAEFVKSRETLEPAADELDEVIEQMKDRGFLLSTDGPLHNVLKIKPPIVFNKQNTDELITNLDEVLEDVGEL